MLIDTHCHLDFPQFDKDRDAVIKRSKDNKIKYIINVGSSINSSYKSRELADKFDNIYFSVGFHPHYADEFNDSIFDKLILDVNSEKLVAVGEVGLDYCKSRSGKVKQKEVFLKFIKLAKKLNLSLIIHCRESQNDIYSILKNEFSDFKKIVFHCFSGPVEFFEKCLDLGAMFSFTANVTFPKAIALKEIVKKVPLDKIMLETDAPYLAPQKFRGQRNEPSYVHLIAQEVARLKNLSFQDVSNFTTQNAISFFKLNEN
ncbi:MAG: TatD family hydrolase [Candidatus Omnitrophota bacterium]